MGVFEFILVLVVVSTIGKVASDWAQRGSSAPPPPPLPPGDTEGLRESLEELQERVNRLEEERDFYRNLLEDPRRKEGGLPSPDE